MPRHDLFALPTLFLLPVHIVPKPSLDLPRFKEHHYVSDEQVLEFHEPCLRILEIFLQNADWCPELVKSRFLVFLEIYFLDLSLNGVLDCMPVEFDHYLVLLAFVYFILALQSYLALLLQFVEVVHFVHGMWDLVGLQALAVLMQEVPPALSGKDLLLSRLLHLLQVI